MNDINKISTELIKKFLSGKRLTNAEFNLLDKFLNDSHYQQEITKWFEEEWQQSNPEIVSLSFDEIRNKISLSKKKSLPRIRTILDVLTKAAAVLLLPVIAGVLYFYLHAPATDELLTLSTQKGEQTSVILPDGSKVWLNVDTKLFYNIDYGVKNRRLQMEGEGYFEVEKNKDLPFEVKSGSIITTALGTKFAISAYPQENIIKSSLVSGSVEITHQKEKRILEAGQQVVFDKNENEMIIKTFDQAEELAWKNDQLIFRLTPFKNVVTNLEKWYDINIEYNPASFDSETLTVRFGKDETLEHVLQVMSKANGFTYKIEGKNVRITKNKH